MASLSTAEKFCICLILQATARGHERWRTGRWSGEAAVPACGCFCRTRLRVGLA